MLARIVSATIAGVITIVAVYKEFPFFDILIFAMFLGLLYEWSMLSTKERFHPFCFFSFIMIFCAVYLGIVWSFVVLVIFFLASPLFFYRKHKKLMLRESSKTLLSIILDLPPEVKLPFKAFIKKHYIFILGCFYICFSIFIFIRFNHLYGKFFTLWLLLLVWSSDVGAYALGKLFEGPLLAPKISPKKTWSGLLGGTLTSFFLSFYMGMFLDIPFVLSISFLNFIILTIVIVVNSHIGDLIESFIKRFYNIKDSGIFLPGHGGFLDRLDSLLWVNIVLWFMLLVL
ncbi:MAG: phosphatidate cytidylyltransferase [Alphaproteobacteria bacterium]